jgi:23S rRNA (guanosine2251-2'-O)-methyltransferase
MNVVVIAHDMRSTHNVGSLLRTADGLGAKRVYLTGYTPYPTFPGDSRLPHIHQKLTDQIRKTALGVESTDLWRHQTSVTELIDELREEGYQIIALEQAPESVNLADFSPSDKLAIILGREVDGIEPDLLARADKIVEIPMHGVKESLNVVQAAAIALYHCLQE